MAFEDALKKAGLGVNDLKFSYEAVFIQERMPDKDNFVIEDKHKGFIFATNEKFLFVKDSGLFSPRIMFNANISDFSRIDKISLVHRVNVNFIPKKENSGFFKRLFGSKSAKFDLKNPEDFIKKMNSLK